MQAVLITLILVAAWVIGIFLSAGLLCIPFGAVEYLGWADFTNEHLWLAASIVSSIGTSSVKNQ